MSVFARSSHSDVVAEDVVKMCCSVFRIGGTARACSSCAGHTSWFPVVIIRVIKNGDLSPGHHAMIRCLHARTEHQKLLCSTQSLLCSRNRSQPTPANMASRPTLKRLRRVGEDCAANGFWCGSQATDHACSIVSLTCIRI